MRLTYAPWGETLAEQVDAARDAEAAGFTDVWVSELHRSAFVPAAAIASATATVGVGTAIALAFTRSPMTTALTTMDVDEIADGRFRLGLGSGVQRLNERWHNATFGKPAAHLRETVAAIRAVIARSHLGEEITLDGDWEPLSLRGYERPAAPRRTSVPIYLASVGPVMTRLTGEIADGWLGHELGSPGFTRDHLLPNLERGLERAGRGRAHLDIVASACCVIDDDGAQAKRWAAGLVAFYASVRTYREFFDEHGFGAEARAVQQHFRDGDEAAMTAAVPDEMVDALTFAGTADEVRSRLTAYEGLVDAIKLSPPTHLVPAEATRAAQRGILEALQP